MKNLRILNTQALWQSLSLFGRTAAAFLAIVFSETVSSSLLIGCSLVKAADADRGVESSKVRR